MQVDLGTTHYSEGAQTAPIFSLATKAGNNRVF